MIRTCVITGFGINADDELQKAFTLADSAVDKIHVSDLIRTPDSILRYHILALPGGFSFGDHLGSGKVLASLIKKNLRGHLEKFTDSGGLIIGICNGFQVLVKMGILPNLAGTWLPEVTLIHNDSGKFEDRWVNIRFNSKSPCVWTDGLIEMELPVRHGEGKFVTASMDVLDTLRARELIGLTYSSRADRRTNGATAYPDNPNGSTLDIAGICDASGRILGLMPHPEAFILPENHPRWTRGGVMPMLGLEIFKKGVQHAKKNLGRRPIA